MFFDYLTETPISVLEHQFDISLTTSPQSTMVYKYLQISSLYVVLFVWKVTYKKCQVYFEPLCVECINLNWNYHTVIQEIVAAIMLRDVFLCFQCISSLKCVLKIILCYSVFITNRKSYAGWSFVMIINVNSDVKSF